jgi:hypothetical protein
MKFRSILVASILLSALVVRDAHADNICSLTISPSSYIEVGQTFSFGIYIRGLVWPGPPPPLGYPGPPFTVVFHGSKNGVDDIPPAGEAYPVTFNSVGQWTLTGYGNPGGLSGTYLRYAKIYAYNPYDPNNPRGYLYCTTNIVAAVLQ